MKSLARMPALAAGVSSMGETTLMTPSSIVHFDAEAAELAGGVFLHVGVVDRLQIAGVRIERGQHAVDRGVDQLLLVGRIDIFGADAVEHFAEQRQVGIDLVGLRGAVRRRLGSVGARCRRVGGEAPALRDDGARRPGRSEHDGRRDGSAEGRQAHQSSIHSGSGCRRCPPSGGVDGLVVFSHFNIERRPGDASTGGDRPANCP